MRRICFRVSRLLALCVLFAALPMPIGPARAATGSIHIAPDGVSATGLCEGPGQEVITGLHVGDVVHLNDVQGVDSGFMGSPAYPDGTVVGQVGHIGSLYQGDPPISITFVVETEGEGVNGCADRPGTVVSGSYEVEPSPLRLVDAVQFGGDARPVIRDCGRDPESPACPGVTQERKDFSVCQGLAVYDWNDCDYDGVTEKSWPFVTQVGSTLEIKEATFKLPPIDGIRAARVSAIVQFGGGAEVHVEAQDAKLSKFGGTHALLQKFLTPFTFPPFSTQDLLRIDWTLEVEFGTSDSASFFAGRTEHRVFVSLGRPKGKEQQLHSVLANAIPFHSQIADESQAIDAIWSAFAGRDITRVRFSPVDGVASDAEALAVYGGLLTTPFFCSSTLKLERFLNKGVARCAEFPRLLNAMLKLQDVDYETKAAGSLLKKAGISQPSGSFLLLGRGNWLFGAPTHVPESPYTNAAQFEGACTTSLGDLAYQPNLTAQNADTPIGTWRNQYPLVLAHGELFDPTFAYRVADIMSWSQSVLAGFGKRVKCGKVGKALLALPAS
ncbi:MAG: hypothetical protein IT293_18000 [Deltaproteobacteria bacterium]|nr:hypothetical protein [Deltaproteobacteria bacterium]